MRTRERHWLWFYFPILFAGCALAAVAAQGCAANPAPTAEPIVPPLAVLIDNKGFYDADVWVLSNDAIVRKIGTVSGLSSHRYALVGQSFAPGQRIAFYARTIAAGRKYRSDAITIPPGLGIRWTLEERGDNWMVPMSQAGH